MDMHTAEAQNTNTVQESQLYGYLAEFSNVDAILTAAVKVREAGFKNWDVHTPFPVHGMDKAMGIRPTILPWISMVCGMTGTSVGLLMQWWMNAVDYPYMISGKPYFSLPAFIPVIFELTILFGALSTVAGVIGLCGLPKLYHPLITSERFLKVTDDKFFISIEANDPKFDKHSTKDFLTSLGSDAVEEVQD